MSDTRLEVMTRCGTCGGHGRILGQVAFTCGAGCSVERDPVCYVCGGRGSVSEQRAEWIERGASLRLQRQAFGRTLREEAERRGMTAVRLSDMEHGRIEPEVAK